MCSIRRPSVWNRFVGDNFIPAGKRWTDTGTHRHRRWERNASGFVFAQFALGASPDFSAGPTLSIWGEGFKSGWPYPRLAIISSVPFGFLWSVFRGYTFGGP